MFSRTSTRILRTCTSQSIRSLHTSRTLLSSSSNPSSTFPKFTIEDRDIVIVGGGPVGLALASALGSNRNVLESCRISLVDASNFEKMESWKPPLNEWSNRVSSITNENLSFLQRIGAWAQVDETRTCPMHRMEVWDGISSARITFDASDVVESSTSSPHSPYMARFVENVHLQKALLKNLQQHHSSRGNIVLEGNQKVESIERDLESQWPIVTLSSGKQLRARLLIGADGFNSPVKAYSEISSHGWNYDAQCVVGNLIVEPSGNNFTAWQRFLTTGPLGFLPLDDQTASLAWSTKPPIASALKQLPGQVLAQLINACFKLPHESVAYLLNRVSDKTAAPTPSELVEDIQWRLSPQVHDPNSLPFDYELPPRVVDVKMSTVASFPLRMFHANSYIGQAKDGVPTRTVLVGDAAHVIHPMAGQGLNMGLGDARVLAHVIGAAIEHGQDIGSYTALTAYARQRYLLNHGIMGTVDKLHKLYSVESGPLVWARSVGVEVLQEIPFLKAAMMGTAGGDATTHDDDGAGRWGQRAASAWEAARSAREVGNVVASMGLQTVRKAAAVLADRVAGSR